MTTQNKRAVSRALAGFTGRSILIHLLTYLVIGAASYWLVARRYWTGQDALPWLRNPEGDFVQRWFLPAQIVRGVLHGVALYPLRTALLDMPRSGGLVVASLLLLIGSIAGISGIIEDWVYSTTFRFPLFMAHLPEILLQTLVYGYWLLAWERRVERKWAAVAVERIDGEPNADSAYHKPWWKGARGEWLVVAQVVLMGLVFLGPRTVFSQPAWPFPFPYACPVVGGALIVVGGALFVAGLVRLGRGLTPLPYPKDGGELIQTGPFALVRHPMYSGGLVLGLGWALVVQGWMTLGYVVALFMLLDVKSRREEKWLAERFPAYVTYRQRVHKLIPFIY